MSPTKRFGSILVALDTRLDHHPILAQAAAIAKAHDSEVTLMDVVPSLSWLARWSSEADRLRNDAREAVEQRLSTHADFLRQQGLQVHCKAVDGVAWQAIATEARTGDHHLALAVSKGQDSDVQGPYGLTGRRLLRQCPVPLLLVRPDAGPTPKRVLACVDTSTDGPDAELNERVYQLAAGLCADLGAELSIVHAWEMEDEAILAARLTKEQVQRFLDQQEEWLRERLERFLGTFGPDLEHQVHLVKGEPARVVAQVCESEQIDLVVMGTVARGGLKGLLLGNTAEAILEGIDTSVLAVKPYSFRSPLL